MNEVDGILSGQETFPRILQMHAKQRPSDPAMREKDLGIWQSWTWMQVAQEVHDMAAGLAADGFKRGDHLAIIGDNRPRLYMAFLAAQSLGGVPVPMYQDAVAAEMAYVLENAEIKFAFVEDQEQVDKLLEIRDSGKWSVERIYYEDPRGLRNYTQKGVGDYPSWLKRGQDYAKAHPGFIDAEIAKGAPDDVSVMLYTSGTTGKPKGVRQTHRAFITAARGGIAFDKLTPHENILSYLPMAWVGDHLLSYAQAITGGFTLNCPESQETVMTDLREIGPTYYFAPPRIFESLLTNLTIRMEDAGSLKKWLFNKAMAVAKKCGADILDGKPVAVGDKFAYSLYNVLVFGPLKNTLGMSRIRVAYTAGAAIGPELFRFYRSIGINLKQLYGSTETCAYVCLQPDGKVKLDKVGTAAKYVDLKIADNGEVLARGPMVMKEYYKRPDATAESIDKDGYFHTGDAGIIDEDGQLKIIDRAADVGKLATGDIGNKGAMFAPNYIENKLKFFPYIKEAVCFGNGLPEVYAFINIDLQAVGNWAERKGLVYSGYIDLAGKKEVYELISDCVAQTNAELAKEGEMTHSQIGRFLILHKELDPDDDELTRTRKVRRGFIEQKYQPLVAALIANKAEQFIETLVKFEDGRTGTISATLKIASAKKVGQA